jgi:hypothetical protein
MSRARWIFVVGGVAVCVIGGGVAFGRMETARLRYELQGLREQCARKVELRAENARLRSGQISEEELERLRADHAALPRLRAEIEALRKRIEGGGR